MITAITSAVHGSQRSGEEKEWYKTKGLMMAIHALSYSGLFYVVFGLWGLAVFPICVAWWFVLRGSKQAKIELDKMDTWNDPYPSYNDVLKAHYYTGWLTCLSLKFYHYDRRPDLVNNGKFWDCRRPTELATGLSLDVVLVGIMTIV